MPDGPLPGRALPALTLPHPHDDHPLQTKRAIWNRTRLALRAPRKDWRAALDEEYAMGALEIDFIATMRKAQIARALTAPHEPRRSCAGLKTSK